jgi:hypothetical protein
MSYASYGNAIGAYSGGFGLSPTAPYQSTKADGTLSNVAKKLVGDPLRWRELPAVNKQIPHIADGTFYGNELLNLPPSWVDSGTAAPPVTLPGGGMTVPGLTPEQVKAALDAAVQAQAALVAAAQAQTIAQSLPPGPAKAAAEDKAAVAKVEADKAVATKDAAAAGVPTGIMGWWGKQSTGIKVGIAAGAALLVIGIGWMAMGGSSAPQYGPPRMTANARRKAKKARKAKRKAAKTRRPVAPRRKRAKARTATKRTTPKRRKSKHLSPVHRTRRGIASSGHSTKAGIGFSQARTRAHDTTADIDAGWFKSNRRRRAR